MSEIHVFFLVAFLAVFLCPPPWAAAIQGGETNTKQNEEKLENRGFTMVKPCFLTTFTDFVICQTKNHPEEGPGTSWEGLGRQDSKNCKCDPFWGGLFVAIF